MRLDARRDLVGRWRAEYAAATKRRKGEILDALCEATGWGRKHAIEALRELPLAKGKRTRRRKKTYGPNEEAALVKVWRLSGFLSSKRLAPFLPEFLDALERHGELALPEPARTRLAGMSAATVDRLLKRHRSAHPRPPSATRPGGLLKSQVAVRRGTEWDDARPGFCEVDTVAHCGGTLQGEFLWTLTLTDVATGWTELAALRSKGRAETLAKLKGLRARLPFPLLGLDSDNGSEFLNHHMARFCEEQGIVFTRCRPYVKNDQCRVEQKNRSVVRRHAGYGRYEADAHLALLARIYGLLRLLVNFYEPSLKGKEGAMTPYRRLLASGAVGEDKARDLGAVYGGLNPVALRRELDRAKMELYGMVGLLDEDEP